MSSGKSIFDRLKSIFSTPVKPEDVSSPRPLLEKVSKTLTSEDGVPGCDNPKRKVAAPRRRKVSDQPPAAGCRTEASLPAVDLTLGIDFGTSCTKVVIGDHGWLGQSYAVPIGGDEITGLGRFLRSTRLEANGKVESNLKMRLMENPGSLELRDLATLYLAGVIRDSLEWFSTEKAARYKGRNIRWSLNLGFAAKQIDDGPLAKAYKEIASLAAQLGPSILSLNLDSVRRIRNFSEADSSLRIIPSARIALYPEIAAQLAGYVNSPYRAQGNLVLIDVGAGTLDVSTAILHGGVHEDIFSFHVCEVKPLGALKLLEARLAIIGKILPGSVQKKLGDFQSGTMPIPEGLSEIVGRKRCSQSLIRAFAETSQDFGDEAIMLAIACASRFRLLQRNAHANASYDPWPGQLRFFFTGGGSRLNFYRDLFLMGRFEQELSRYTRWKDSPEQRSRHLQGLRHEPLPAPHDLQGLPIELTSDFDRLSVAHGLAYGCENLMKVTASVQS